MPELILKVVKVWMETPTIAAVRLDLAGQKFQFKAGQYCLVAFEVNGEEQDHTFSIACAPNADYVEFATRLSDSIYKKTFAALKVGDEVKVTGPLGNFTLDPLAKSVCFLSGGIGITPIRSVIQFATREKLQLPITLLFGNRNPSEIPFKAELDELQKQNKLLKVVNLVNEGGANWTGTVGRIDEEIVKKYSLVDSDFYYICGPPGMVQGLTEMLRELEVDEKRIKVEHFTGYK